jgi:predicted RND superfamily exporter protein
MVEAFQRHIQNAPNVGGSVSIVDLLKKINMRMHDDHPKWEILPHDRKEIAMLYYLFQSGSDPGDMDPYVTSDNRAVSIMTYFRDHRGGTINSAIEHTRDFMTRTDEVNGSTFRMAGGVVGVLSAVNEVITHYQVMNLALMFLSICFFCYVCFRSLIGTVIIMIPLALATLLTFAFMVIVKIDLNINTLPVASLGIGLGVDYGIYILSRIHAEYGLTHDLDQAIRAALSTSGTAVLFAAMTLTAGVVFWCFSEMRFQALMGLLLAFLFLVNMVGAMVLLPALTGIIKPKFLEGR